MFLKRIIFYVFQDVCKSSFIGLHSAKLTWNLKGVVYRLLSSAKVSFSSCMLVWGSLRFFSQSQVPQQIPNTHAMCGIIKTCLNGFT